MLQSLSDSLKVKAQAILDNFDPEKLTKINSFFNNCLGKISNFALQKAQHNFTQTRESSPPTTCTNSHTTRTGIPCKHRIMELLELGLLAQPEHFDPQWHLRHQGGLVGGLNSTEGGVGRRCGQSRNFLERRHPKKTPGTERRHPNFVAEGDWEPRHPKKTPGTERRHPKHDWERRHPKKTPGTERRHPKHDWERRHPKETPGTERRHPNFVAEGDWERRHPKKTLEPNEWQLGDLKTTENMNLDEEMEKIKTHLKSFDTLTQREKLDKIYEILDNNPHSLGKRENSAEEPTQQNKKLKIQPTSTPFIPSSKSSASITIPQPRRTPLKIKLDLRVDQIPSRIDSTLR
ncbi:hypothetical protein PSTT_11096 [Puccinia striiformis]|uniref:SWIM-type domain-containing protein n=1 Tax=Puccinia striiformis TaxID=27350 RepID=A0A2S4V1T0_9BASI|nr:hypothetical protein PSTT_11096 [Puccinia striiformis]